MSNHKSLYISLLVSLFSLSGLSQYRDAGLWSGVSGSFQTSKKIQLNLAGEIRLRENLSQMSRLFYEAGVEYKLKKWLDGSITYRGGTANNNPYFDYRQRLQFGLAAKKKFDKFAITFQSRWQLGINGISSESDADFYTTLRNKFQFKYTGLKGIDLSTSYEIFNNTGAYQSFAMQNWRWVISAEKKLNKRNFLSLGYMIQKGLLDSPQEYDFIILVNYKFELDLRKKDTKTEENPEKKP
ncbi:MAG: DUF2490 domain-containing protein [Flavobacteriales bacterium]|nr:DUF2490 domain-containing protein [Flavobacteriales bacterium]